MKKLAAFFFIFISLSLQGFSAESKCKDIDEYIKYVKKTLKENWKPHYSNHEGMIVLLFKIKDSGEIYDINIVKSGGTLLDLQAINTLKALSPFDSFPKKYNCDYMDASFNFKYHNYKEKKFLEEQSAVGKNKEVNIENNSGTFYYK